MSRKQQESLVAHQKQLQSTSSSGGVDRVPVPSMTTSHETTMMTTATATRLSPLSHEVTSTTEGDEEAAFTVKKQELFYMVYFVIESNGGMVQGSVLLAG